jgi:hypothetical protein
MKGPRISKKAKEFNDIIVNGDNHLQANEPVSGLPYWQLLGLSSANATDWHNKRLVWDTPDTGKYALYSNPATSTSVVKKDVKDFIDQFRIFADPVLDKIAANENATALEEKIFNLILKRDRKKPGKSHTHIADQCITALISEKGGRMKVASRSAHDSKRASLAEGADGVQYAYLIMDENPKTVATRTAAVDAANAAAVSARQANPGLPIPVPAPLPTPIPLHPDDGTKQEFFSGATHEFILGASNEGKYLCMWSRWYNSKHPELAGDWSEMQMALIG